MLQEMGSVSYCLRHALAFIHSLYETSRRILDGGAMAGMSAIAAKGAAELAAVSNLPASTRSIQITKGALETLMSLVGMAAAGCASSALLHCPVLSHALHKASILPAGRDSPSDSDLSGLRWVVAVEVRGLLACNQMLSGSL